VGSVLLSLVIGSAFAALVGAISYVRDAAVLARHSARVMAIANELERQLVDLETGERGFLITGDEKFLGPWTDARAKFGGKAADLQRMAAAHSARQGRQAGKIAQDGAAYIREYSEPVVAAARRDLASVRSPEVTDEGKARVDRLRAEFRDFGQFERRLAVERDERSARAARQGVVWAVGGLAGSVLLILIFGGYLTRDVVRPVRRASVMAGELAHGDLKVRMPETGRAEIGHLERSFNTMARSLQVSQDGLRGLLEEQAALHRVATLVAHGVPPPEVFDAVAGEMGRILGADYTAIERYEHDDSVTTVGSWSGQGVSGARLPVGSRWSLEGQSVSASVHRTGRSARMNGYEHATGELGTWARERETMSSSGSPIIVEGDLWGVAIAFWISRSQTHDVEGRMSDFTGLLATAIANTESRAELTASRARVVAAGDAARRRIERDLHDGAQQRLVSLGIDLRLTCDDLPLDQEVLKGRLLRSMRDLTDIVEDLHEISRGIHPAILSKGGLGPALKALVRRCAIPVELSTNIDRKLDEQIEVAVYYVVSEALTNATKYANASVVWVNVSVQGAVVQLSVRDDGIGGADPCLGSGLIGLKDRVEALGGRIQITSPAGVGTTLAARIPMKAP
jgi:signal transduction histidine kinase/CHASE3 domain sensor protein